MHSTGANLPTSLFSCPEQQLGRTAHVFFLLIPAPPEVNVSGMLVGVGSDLSSPKPGRDAALKRTPPFTQVSRRGFGQPNGVGMLAGTSALCSAVHAHYITSASTGLSPHPQHPPAAVKQHRLGQGWSGPKHTQGIRGRAEPVQTSLILWLKCRSGAGFSPAQ